MPYRDLIIVGGSSLAGAVTFAGARGLYEKVKADRAGEELKWSLIAPKLASAALAGAFVGYPNFRSSARANK